MLWKWLNRILLREPYIFFMNNFLYVDNYRHSEHTKLFKVLSSKFKLFGIYSSRNYVSVQFLLYSFC